MPRYYFDTNDGTGMVEDEDGIELASLEAARNSAIAGIVDLARDYIPGADRKELAVEVRDEANDRLLRASLRFEVAVLDPRQPAR